MAICWGVVMISDEATSFFFVSRDYLSSCLLPSSFDLLKVVGVDPAAYCVLVLPFGFRARLPCPYLLWEYGYVLVISFSLVVVRSP